MVDFPPLASLVKFYGRTAKKALGQNYLANEEILRRIAGHVSGQSTDKDDHLVIEIGPGPGGLTRELLKRAPGALLAIEKDEGFRAALQPLVDYYPDSMTVLFSDALEVLTLSIGRPQSVQGLSVVGNLPFGISSVLLLKLVRAACSREETGSSSLLRNILQRAKHVEMILMFQEEVAQRITAAPGNSARSKLSVLVQQFFDAQYLFFVPRTCFFPKPEVDAAVIKLVKRTSPRDDVLYDEFEEYLSLIFAQPRKKIVNSLKTLQFGDRVPLFVDMGSRPFQLDNELILRLYHWYREHWIRS